MDHNVGVCGYDLLFGCQFGTLLELEIANGSGQRQITVHSAKIDKAAGSCDSCLLAYTRQAVRPWLARKGWWRQGWAKRAPSFCGL